MLGQTTSDLGGKKLILYLIPYTKINLNRLGFIGKVK